MSCVNIAFSNVVFFFAFSWTGVNTKDKIRARKMFLLKFYKSLACGASFSTKTMQLKDTQKKLQNSTAIHYNDLSFSILKLLDLML